MKSIEIMDALTDMDDEMLLRAEADPSRKRMGTRKTVNFRWLGRIAAIAAVVMLLTLTAFAADGIINGEWFGGYFGTTLSDNQKEFVENSGRTFTESLSVNGATITPISAISDKDIYYLHLRLEAPEGVVLEDLGDDCCYDFQPYYYHPDLHYYELKRVQIKTYWGTALHTVSCSHSVKTLPDEDPADNVKEFVLILQNEDKDSMLNGPGQKTLYIPGLFVRKIWDQKDVETKIVGPFKIDMTNYVEDAGDQKLVIDLDDLAIYNEKYDFTTTVEKVVITPFALTRYFTATEPNYWDISPTGGSVRLVMKDGKSILVGDHGEYNFGRDEGYLTISEVSRISGLKFGEKNEHWIGYENTSYLLPEPIVLDDIDYIVIANEHTIDVN